MEKFSYHNPTKIVSGKETHTTIGKQLKGDGINSVLLVYGKSSVKRSGLLDQVKASLENSAVQYIEHGGVQSNPVLTHAERGAQLASEHNMEGVLALGGGSVIDECKGIAAAAQMGCKVWDLYTGTKASGALPLYTILTISATGSEMNGGSVLTNEETHEKFSFSSPFVYPKLSIINPELHYTLPADYMAYSAVDVILHTVEVYFNASVMPDIQKRFMENIVRTVIDTTEIILKEPENYDARAEFSIAATWALNNMTAYGNAGYAYPNHMIEHSLSALYDVAHGAGLAVVLPAWMRYFKSEKTEIFRRFAKEIFGKSSAQDAIDSVSGWFKQIGAPITLQELEIPKEDIPRIAENAYLTSQRWGMTETYSKEVIEEILKLA